MLKMVFKQILECDCRFLSLERQVIIPIILNQILECGCLFLSLEMMITFRGGCQML